jgi:hypothetical protein
VSIAILAQLPPNEQDPEAVRNAADDILAGSDYETAEPEWLDRAWEWVLERLRDLLDGLEVPGLGGGGTGGSSGISWLLLLIGVGLLVWLIVRYRRHRVPKDDEPESTVVLDPHRSADEWREEARRLEELGRWDEAIRAEYRAMVGDLVDADLLPDIPGRTAGEYRQDVRRDLPQCAAPFDEATDLFEPVWYSDFEPTRAGLTLMRDLAARIDPEGPDGGSPVGSGADPSEAGAP